jgi:hypothetical protein
MRPKKKHKVVYTEYQLRYIAQLKQMLKTNSVKMKQLWKEYMLATNRIKSHQKDLRECVADVKNWKTLPSVLQDYDAVVRINNRLRKWKCITPTPIPYKLSVLKTQGLMLELNGDWYIHADLDGLRKDLEEHSVDVELIRTITADVVARIKKNKENSNEEHL